MTGREFRPGALVALLIALCPVTLLLQAPAADEWTRQRARMVELQIRQRGVTSERVLGAMLKVPRHLFVPEEVIEEAYADHPLPIGLGQTISQPFVVAYMTDALQVAPADKVLEIGTGSGYQAAVLAELAREVYTMEIVPELARRARATLDRLGYANVKVRLGNGYLGWPDAAPFDKIIVTAAPDQVPKALVDQLGPTGVLIAPVGVDTQTITIVRRTPRGLVQEQTIPVLFVPMTGKGKK
jgi:protein-L-isoaspartate(D-aspartate) O-methyltransferase